MRIYMMERFLERVSVSKYKDNFVIKGGMLVTAIVGVALRSTMDIDTSLKNQNLCAEDARRIISEIKDMQKKKNKADAKTLMRIYMMERFLERVSVSKYKDNFVIKGGMLVTAMVGVALRSTMDIDTSLKNQDLSAEDAQRIISEIKDTDIGDGVTFEIKEVSNIMDEMEYPGIRFTMNAVLNRSASMWRPSERSINPLLRLKHSCEATTT